MRAVERTSQVCESLLFGPPVALVPTTDGHLEWDDIEHHRQAFSALLRTLINNVSANNVYE